MVPRPRPWPILVFYFLFCIFALGTAYVFYSLWVVITAVAAAAIIGCLLALSLIKAYQNISAIDNLSELRPTESNPIAYKLLGELLVPGPEKRANALRAQELIREALQIDKFVILFKEEDRYIPKIFAGLNRNELASPSFQRLSASLRRAMQEGVLSTAENDIRFAFKNDSEPLAAPVAFVYSWGRNKSVLVVADDTNGYFSQIVKESHINRTLWPGLEYILRMNQKVNDKNYELKQLVQQLGQSQKEMADLNRELKNRMLDIQSFVKVSNQLYSLFNEEQLFLSLRNIIGDQLGALRVEMLVPSGENNFIVKPIGPAGQQIPNLVLDYESEFCEIIMKSSRPVLLPLVGSGLKKNDPFLSEAIARGFMAASVIRADARVACVLLVGERGNQAQYSNQDIDFLYVISNIASLALDNIIQYSTIEKLSYTDSMTEIYNYRYFYKRLNEEVLRARRFERELALVILDIDNFKTFNDNFGHQAGDLILKQLSDLITRTIRSIDVVSRYGGEEFCIIMPDTGFGNCSVFIERLRSQIAEFQFDSALLPKGNHISISVGGAVFPQHASNPDRLIYCADMALLKAKSLGRNQAIMYVPELSLDVHPAEGGFNESHQETIF